MAKRTPLEESAMREKASEERARLRKDKTAKLDSIDEMMGAGREALDEQRRETRFKVPELEERSKTAYKKGGSVNKYAKGGDVQSESSKLDQRNAAKDKAQDEGFKRYQAEQAKEAKENAGPRESMGKAVDFVKKGLGMKSGGSVKSASKRADGIAIRGKTRA